MKSPTGPYGVHAVNLKSKSGSNLEELRLLDEQGCPLDSSIFGYLKYTNDGSKSLISGFEAFKFTNDPIVRFTVDVSFCRSQCEPVGFNTLIN